MYSVIIPSYNSEFTILSTIDSILQQTLPPSELIVVDDCSSDSTVVVLASLNLANLKIIRNYKNQGPAFCRNLGISIAKTEWVAFMDADDLWHPQKMEIQILVANQLGKDFISCGFSTHISKPKFMPIKLDLNNFNFKKIGFSRLIFKNIISTPSVLLNSRLAPIFNPKFRLCEDFDLWLRLAKQSDLVFVDLPLVSIYRPTHHKGLSGNIFKMEAYELIVLASFFIKHPLRIMMAIFFSLLKFLKRLISRSTIPR